jgi:RimJ/RimL family protein N-acetyltransferase
MFENELILENEIVKLRLLSTEDLNDFNEISDESSIWEYFTSDLSNEENIKIWIDEAQEQHKAKSRYPFTIIDKILHRTAGSTSFGNFSERDRRIEIGWTWLGKKFQGSGINKHCKFLLLQYAFEVLNFERVEFKTDVLNLQARKALEKIGAVEEGILRSHTLMPHNRRRDTIFYSILRNDWLQLKKIVFKDIVGGY